MLNLQIISRYAVRGRLAFVTGCFAQCRWEAFISAAQLFYVRYKSLPGNEHALIFFLLLLKVDNIVHQLRIACNANSKNSKYYNNVHYCPSLAERDPKILRNICCLYQFNPKRFKPHIFKVSLLVYNKCNTRNRK